MINQFGFPVNFFNHLQKNPACKTGFLKYVRACLYTQDNENYFTNALGICSNLIFGASPFLND